MAGRGSLPIVGRTRARYSAGVTTGTSLEAAPLRAPLLLSQSALGTMDGKSDQRVLVAEDDPVIRGLLHRLLSGAGYAVTAVPDGEAAWDAVNRGSVDLLVTDHDMPRLLGLDLIRRLRSFSHRLPIVFMSGSMPWHTTDLKGLLRPGITLEKPFQGAVLIAHVQALLAKASLAFGNRSELSRGSAGLSAR